MKCCKRFISMLLALILSLSLISGIISPTYADSNDRISTFLKMAAGAEITDADVSGLTMDQLQFLGVYLSNFYQSFGTEFGGSNDKIAENCKEDMVTALQTKLHFSDEMATALVEYVLEMTRETTQYLDLYVKDTDGSFSKLSNINCNYYNFIRLMLGKSDNVFSGYMQQFNGISDPWENECNLGLFSDVLEERVFGDQISAEFVFVDSDDSYYEYYEGKNTTRDILWPTLNKLTKGIPSWSEYNASYMSESVASSFSGHSASMYYKDAESFLKVLYLYLSSGGKLDIYNPKCNDDWESNYWVNSAIAIDFSVRQSRYGSHYYYWRASKLGKYRCKTYQMPTTGSDSHVIATSVLKLDNSGLWEDCEKLVQVIDSADYLYFGYDKNGEVKIVYDCTTAIGLNNGNNFTASQVEFMKCLETVDMVNGYGINLLDFNMKDGADDTEWDSTMLQSVCSKLADVNSLYANKELSLKSTIWGQRIGIDCFGNILCMGANHQYIIVPACMNPYSWQAVDSNGKDIDNSAGAFINIVNATNIVQADKGMIGSVPVRVKYIPSSGGTISSNYNRNNSAHLVVSIDNFVTTSTGYTGIGNVLSSDSLKVNDEIPARIIRGQGNYVVNDNCWWPWGGEDIAKTSIQNLVLLFNEMYPYDKTANNASKEEDVWGFWSDEYIPLIRGVSTITDTYLKTCNTVNIMDGYVFIDNLGVYKNSDGSDRDYSAFNIESYLNHSDGTSAGSIAGGVKAESDFGSHANMIISGNLNILDGCSEQALSSIYVSYVYAYFYSEDNKADTIGKLGYRYAKENFPDPSTATLNIDLAVVQVDLELEAIRDWTYYLLHPTKGYKYVTTLFSNKLNHILLDWHSDMVGTNGVGIMTGTTKYRSNVGYVTMPDLSEIEWTDKLISFYQDCLPFLIIVIIVLMLLAFITGVLSLQRAIFAAVLFSLFLILPTTIINGCVQMSNNVSQRVYGEKFTYWAMVQQESYASKIDEAANAAGGSGNSSYSNYLRTLYGLNEKVYSNQGGESIVLKWQAPKKMASLVLSSADAQSMGGLSDVGKSMLHGMLNSAYSGQSYVDDVDAVYMYRSYIDISNFSRYIYQGIDTGKVNSTSNPASVRSTLNGSFSQDLVSAVGDLADAYEQYRQDGYTNWGMSESSSNPEYNYVTVPLSSSIIADAIRESSGLSTWNSTSDLVSINQDVFNFGLPMFTNSSMDFSLKNFASTGAIPEGTTRYNNLRDYLTSYSGDAPYVGLAAYSLYSESSFYYFSWKMYHDGLGYNSSLYDMGGYKNLLLSKPDGGYFYMNGGNGGLKDFMDMKSLFTYIIPYMKECNDLVREWDETYGIFIYDGVPTEEGHWNDVAGDAELTAKYWHNLNVSRLYCLYSPWVDIMYDCSYAQPETITVMGKRVTIIDPLNPESYPSNRPMIFSEAEMKDYGLSEADLTNVERLILKCNEEMQERMFELLNYYNFSDITLNTAAAMECCFTFNTVFSESGVMSDNHNIYPQSYDLSNFSYDAFLRFILAESTGENLLDTSKTVGTAAGETTGDFYERVVNNSSTTTIILMLVLDVIAIYVLPAFKIFFLVAIFISSLLIVFVSLCKIEDNAKFLQKVIAGFIMPLIKFFAITIGLSLVVSLFMGTGNNSVTQTDVLSISMGDPVIVILVMIVINVLVVVLYWRILRDVFKDIKFNAKLAFNFAGGVLGATAGFVTGAVTGAVGAVRSGVNSAVNTHRYRKTIKTMKGSKDNRKDDPEADPPQEGTGTESTRAANRGSKDVSSSREDSASTSQIGQKVAPMTPGVDSEEKRKKLDEAAKAGAEKLNEQAKQARNDRYDQYSQSMNRDFGYAMREDGTIDTSKLSAKDKYKYESRANRITNREIKYEMNRITGGKTPLPNEGKSKQGNDSTKSATTPGSGSTKTSVGSPKSSTSSSKPSASSSKPAGGTKKPSNSGSQKPKESKPKK